MMLTPPADTIKEPHALVMQNMRPDKAGQLVSRRGSVVTQSGLNANVRGIFSEANSGMTAIASNADLYVNGVSTAGILAASVHACYFAAYLGYIWVLDATARRKVSIPGGNVYVWQIVAPSTGLTAAIGGAGNLTGSDISYVFTFGNSNGHESEPSPVLNVGPGVVAKSLNLASIDVSADPQVDRRFIYRTGGGLDAYYRVGEILDNTTTTFTDNLSAADALAQGIDLPEGEFGILDSFYYGMTGPYLGRMIAWGGQRIAWTPVAKPYRWPEENFEDIGTAGGIYYATIHKRMLVVYGSDSIWRYIGDPDEVPIERTNSQLGCVGTKSVVNAGQFDYFASRDGIYRFNGDVETKISREIEPLFRGDSVRLAGSSYLPPIDPDRERMVLGYQPGRLLVSYPELGQTDPSITLVFDEVDGRWMTWKGGGTEKGFKAMCWTGNANGSAMLAAANSKVYALEQDQISGGFTVQKDDTAAIPVQWQSGHLDFGKPNQYKVFADLEIDFQTAAENLTTAEAASTLTVYASYDNGAITSLGTISSATRTVSTFRLGSDNRGQRAKLISIRIDGSATSTVTVYAMYLHWYLEPRESKTWDSGVVDLEQANEVRALRFDISSTANVTWEIYSDVPGGALALRDTGTISAAGRQQIRVNLGATIDGRRFRVLAMTTGLQQVWKAEMYRRPVGEFMEVNTGDAYIEFGEAAV